MNFNNNNTDMTDLFLNTFKIILVMHSKKFTENSKHIVLNAFFKLEDEGIYHCYNP